MRFPAFIGVMAGCSLTRIQSRPTQNQAALDVPAVFRRPIRLLSKHLERRTSWDVRCQTLQKCNETIHHRLCLDDCIDYERINLEYSMDGLRLEAGSASRSRRPESILRHKS